MNETELLHQSTQAEIDAWEDFRKKYERMFPAPEKPSITLRDVIGWQFWMAILQGIFAIALAAFRTADMFYKIALSSSQMLAVLEAFFAVGAVEGGIVVFAALRAEMQNRRTTGDENSDLKLEVRASVWRLAAGEILGLAISIVAGLGLSFAGLGIDAAQFSFWLAVIVGAGASIIAAISGDVIGATLARLSNARDRVGIQYRAAMKDWEATLYSRWAKSDERAIARGELKAAVRSGRSIPNSRPNKYGQNPAAERTAERPPNEQRERIIAYLEQYMAEHPEAESIPGPSQVSRDLGVSKSYSHQVLNDWMEEKGFVGQEGTAQ